MTVSTGFLAWLVSIATLITGLAPIMLLIFWIRDLVKGRLW